MLPDATEKEPNDDFKKPQVIDGNAVVNGRLEKNGDVDCFAVKLKKGQTLVASLDAHRTLRSPMDGVLQILSADGFVLDENNDYHGLDPQLAFTAKKDGTYVARVFAFPATPDSSIRFSGAETYVYRLTLTTGPFVDYAMPLAITHTGGSVADLVGWNIPPDNSSFKVPAPGGGDVVRHAVEGFANPFWLRVEPHTVLDATRSGFDRTTARDPPVSLAGRIDKAGGEALFAINGKKGRALTIQVESRSLGLAVNPVVRVLDAEKKQLARAEPGKLNTDTTLPFTPPADGHYTIAVGDLFGGGGSRHAFLLRVLSEPDYDLTVAADRFTVTPGKPTTIPVKVNRKLGFAKPVEVLADKLPEGVKFEVKERAKPDPNTVTVTLTAEKPVAGEFRLVGEVKGEPKLRRVVRCPLPEFDEATEELWLTVTPP
jgi:hypothetical protein